MAIDSKPSDTTILSILKNNTAFGVLGDAFLEALLRRGHTKRFSKGDVIFNRGDPGESLMIILSGRIKITNVAANGREVILNFLGIGDITGEIAALDGKERSADAFALEETTAFIIYRRDILPILKQNPQALLDIIQVLCQKLRMASSIVEDNALEMAGRTASGLLRLAHQHGRKTERGLLIDFELPQRDLGSYFSLSRENVSRQLTKLKDEGLIQIADTQICILNENRLFDIAEAGA